MCKRKKPSIFLVPRQDGGGNAQCCVPMSGSMGGGTYPGMGGGMYPGMGGGMHQGMGGGMYSGMGGGMYSGMGGGMYSGMGGGMHQGMGGGMHQGMGGGMSGIGGMQSSTGSMNPLGLLAMSNMFGSGSRNNPLASMAAMSAFR